MKNKNTEHPNSDQTSSAKTNFTYDEAAFIESARLFLDQPSFVIRLANTVGKPIEALLNKVPEKQKAMIQTATQTALQKGLEMVTQSLPKTSSEKTFMQASQQTKMSGWLHSGASFATGAIGGFIGLASLPIELPITTGIILRSIASTAENFGMDMTDPQIRLECLYILSLGSPKSAEDDAMNSSYWTSRVAFSRLIADASRELERGLTPAVVRMLAQVAARFEVVVSEKAMAELVPAIGAVGGGVINAAFTDYFSEAARYHFGLKSLEKKYGVEMVQAAYGVVPREQQH